MIGNIRSEMMQRTRSFRRHHLERLKKKRSKYHGGWAGSSDRTLGLILTTPKPCSCYMCGNPRKHFGERTRQEMLSDQLFWIDE